MKALFYFGLFISPLLMNWLWSHHPREINTALHEAAEQGDVQQVAQLVDDLNLNALNECGWSPLMKAARQGHIEVVRLLLQEGAEVNQRDKGGYTALMLAASNGHLAVVQLLLQAGAQLDDREDSHGWTALDWALAENQIEVANYLAQYRRR